LIHGFLKKNLTSLGKKTEPYVIIVISSYIMKIDWNIFFGDDIKKISRIKISDF